MKTQTHHTVTPYGARFTLLLIPLFAAVVCAAFAILYPGQIASALDTCNDLSSLSNPQISISGIAVPDDALISDVTEISNYNAVVCYDTETADGIKFRYGSVTAFFGSTFRKRSKEKKYRYPAYYQYRNRKNVAGGYGGG